MVFTSMNYYAALEDAGRRPELKRTIEQTGYDAFRALVDQFEQALKEVVEDGFGTLGERLAWCREAFPEPRRFSPTWQNVWFELEEKLRWKRCAFESVPPAERDGEWQIVMDNPFTNSEVVCYPSLSFVEAAYLFGYFKPTLEKNEYLRLQKIVTALELTGE